ncbi:MAG: hypothetical protein ACTSWN_10450 [Promethearchaeota archaeon]
MDLLNLETDQLKIVPKQVQPVLRPLSSPRETPQILKKAPILHLLSDIPELGDKTTINAGRYIDELILSMIWKNPVFRDFPILSSSNEDSKIKSRDENVSGARTCNGHGETSHEIQVASTGSIRQFLKPRNGIDAFINKSGAMMHKNGNLLKKAALNIQLRKIFVKNNKE